MRCVPSLIAALVLALAACTGGDDVARPTAPPTAVSPTPTPTPTPVEPVRFVAVGDVGEGNEGERRVANAIADVHEETPVDVLLLLGDLIYPDGEAEDYERKFARPYRRVLEAGIRIAAALGNHDIRTDTAALMRLFDMPAPYYTFTQGPVQFFAIDNSTASVGGEQRRWLERELARSQAPWKVAFMHVPLYASGRHGSHRGLQRTLGPVFEEHDVQLVLAGHDHHYERTKEIDGVTYVVAGAGCCPRDAGRSDFTEVVRTGLSFVVMQATETRLEGTALTPDGQVLDRFTLEREAAPGAEREAA